MGICFHLFVIIAASGLFFGAESKTYWGDAEVLKELKQSLVPVSEIRFMRELLGLHCRPMRTFTARNSRAGSGAMCGFRAEPSHRTQPRPSGLQRVPLLTWNLPYWKLSMNNPRSFNGLVSLKRLELQSNKFNGQIPNLGSLRNLYYLDLSYNSVAGTLPASLPVSWWISVPTNSVALPSVLFELPSLEQLTLSFNQFSSIEVPSYGQSGLIAVDLSNNQLQGILPSFLGLMPKLSSLSLENNQFTGLIPTLYALKTVFPE
ncbi:Leucine-rich repeat [Sesbania bispinosa]|nr:Leucine-rich repeat [Sesbania bispinosa]